MSEQPSKWWRKLAPVDLAAEPDNVVQMPRPKLDALVRAYKEEQAIMRDIVKSGRELEERYNECEARMNNAKASIAEQLKDLGLTVTETTP